MLPPVDAKKVEKVPPRLSVPVAPLVNPEPASAVPTVSNPLFVSVPETVRFGIEVTVAPLLINLPAPLNV